MKLLIKTGGNPEMMLATEGEEKDILVFSIPATRPGTMQGQIKVIRQRRISRFHWVGVIETTPEVVAAMKEAYIRRYYNNAKFFEPGKMGYFGELKPNPYLHAVVIGGDFTWEDAMKYCDK